MSEAMKCRFCGYVFTDERQYYTDHIGPYCRDQRVCIYRERPDIQRRDEIARLRTQVEVQRQALEIYRNTCNNLIVSHPRTWRRETAQEYVRRAEDLLKGSSDE